MPAKRRSQTPAKKEKPSPAPVPPANSRRSRSTATASPAAARAGSKRKASPSPAPAKASAPKKGRTESASPAPVKKQPARGRSASAKKEEKPSKPVAKSRSASKGDQKQTRVTRAVVEEVETKKPTPARSRSKSKQKAPTPQKKDTPKRSATPKQKAATPKQKATQEKSTPRSRSATPKSQQKSITPKQKSTPKQKTSPKKPTSMPKQKKNVPKQKSTPKSKTPTKTESVRKTTPRRSRSTPSETAVDEVEKEEIKSATADESELEATDDKEMEEENTVTETEEKAEMKDEDPEADHAEEQVEQEQTETENDEKEAVNANEAEDDAVNANEAEDEAVNEIIEKKETEEEAVEMEESITTGTEHEENIAMDVEDESEKDSNEAEESAEAVKDETAAQEDENVEEDQEVVNKTRDVDSEEPAESAEKENEAADDQTDNVVKEDKLEEDAIEQQAESEQIESDGKEECESAESEQVEADVSAPESTKEASEMEHMEAIEINSDESSKDAEIVDEDKAIVVGESNSEDSREEAATEGNIGGGDAQGLDKADKTEETQVLDDDDIQEIGISPAAVIDVEDQAEPVNDVSSSGIEEAQDAVQVLDGGSIVNSSVSNGGTSESGSPRKRKHDEMEGDEEVSPKKARLSFEEDKMENGSLSQESDISKDFVVVEMGEVPPADSQEVKDCLPRDVVQQSGIDQNPIFSRVFIPNPGFSSSGESAKQFSVVSYNVLADCHLFRNDYSFTDAKYLQSEYRLTNLMKELQYLDGDVVCLQEVDPSFYKDTLLPKMQSLGYEGIFKKRTKEYFNEGEATFFKLSRFSLVDYSTPRLADLVEKELSGIIDPALQAAVRQYMDLADVMIVTKLKCKNTGSEITIGNIHVVWGEMKTPDAQCVQIASAIKEIVMKAGVDNLPHLICGDFNSPPLSPGYLVARDGYPTGEETVTKLQEINGLELPEGQRASLVNSVWPAFQHTSSLKSAYCEVEGSEPQITSYNRVMKETVDYIFYSSSSLDNVGILRTANKEGVTATGGIPDEHFPSDHVSLKAVLSFK